MKKGCKQILFFGFLGGKKSSEDEKAMFGRVQRGFACSKRFSSARKKPKGKRKTHTSGRRVSLVYPNTTVLLTCVSADCDSRRSVWRSLIQPAGFRNRKITGLCLLWPIRCMMGKKCSQSSGWGQRWEGLERDEVDQVALGRSHAVGEEVDERVEELRPLSVCLVYVRETWERKTEVISRTATNNVNYCFD